MKRIIVLVLLALPAFGQKTLPDGIEDLARQIGEGVKSAKQQRVAVLPLQDLHHNQSDLGAYIAEELSTSLAIQQVDVIERALLDRVLSELRLQETGAIDPATAKKIGHLAGADAIVAGTVTELPTTLNVNCRVIATATGKVITGARTRITIDADVNTLRKQQSRSAEPSPPGAATEEEPTELAWKRGLLRIVVDAAKRQANHVYVTLAVEHSSDRAQKASIPKYTLIDEHGDKFRYNYDSEGFAAEGVTIPPGTRARSVFTFDCYNSACNGSKFTIVAPDGSIVLRGVPVSEGQ